MHLFNTPQELRIIFHVSMKLENACEYNLIFTHMKVENNRKNNESRNPLIGKQSHYRNPITTTTTARKSEKFLKTPGAGEVEKIELERNLRSWREKYASKKWKWIERRRRSAMSMILTSPQREEWEEIWNFLKLGLREQLAWDSKIGSQ